MHLVLDWTWLEHADVLLFFLWLVWWLVNLVLGLVLGARKKTGNGG